MEEAMASPTQNNNRGRLRVHYCCVAKGGRILHAYNNNGSSSEIEKVARHCVERAPPHHRRYFQTIDGRIYGFLMEDDGFVYFAIADAGVGSAALVNFLLHFRDDFKNIAATAASPRKINNNKGALSRGSRSSSSLGPANFLQEQQLVSVIRRLINSLEQVSSIAHDPSTAPEIEAASSSRAPLLGMDLEMGVGKGSQEEKKTKQKKKAAAKEHAATMCTGEIESGDRGGGSQPHQSSSSSSSVDHSMHKDMDLASVRITRSASQSIRKKWCRQVRTILVIDLVVCLVLFTIWLGICRGFQCIQ